MPRRGAQPLGANYTKLIGASAFSNLADGVFQLALPLLAIRLTRSPSAVASLTFAARVPWLFFGVVAGALADRLDRRSTMVRVDLARAALVGGLGLVVIAGREEIWILYAVALLFGAGETLFDTSSQSILPSIVAPDALSRANGRLYGVEMGMNQFVGPPLGGLLVGVGVALAFTTSAACYVAAGVCLAAISGTYRSRRTGPAARMRADIAEGLRYLWRHRLLRTLSCMAGVSLLTSTAAFALFPLFAVAPGPLGLSEFGFGLLLTSAAVGSVVSSLVTEPIEQVLGRQRTLLLCIVLDGTAIAVLATANVVVAVFVGLALGFSQILWQVVLVSMRQRIVPDHLLGRVNGAHRTVTMGSMAAGAGIGGVLAEWLGIRAVLVASGAATFTLLLLLPIVSEAAIERAEQEREGYG